MMLYSYFLGSFFVFLFVSTLLMIPMLLIELMLLFVGSGFFSYPFCFCSIFGDFYLDLSSIFGRLLDPSTLFKIWFRGLLGWTMRGILGVTC